MTIKDIKSKWINRKSKIDDYLSNEKMSIPERLTTAGCSYMISEFLRDIENLNGDKKKRVEKSCSTCKHKSKGSIFIPCVACKGTSFWEQDVS